MKLQKFVFAVLFFSCSFLLNAQSTEPKTIEAAKEMAAKQNKPIVLEFYADWCSNCKKFDAKTLTNPQVSKLLKDQFIFLKINAEKQEMAFVKEHKIKSYPQFFVLNKEGTVLAKEKGFMNAEEFIEFLTSKKQLK